MLYAVQKRADKTVSIIVFSIDLAEILMVGI